jgi:hypothetical protein
MLATQITTHVADALARFMQQYAGVPTQYALKLISDGSTIDVTALGALESVLVDQIQILEDAIFSIDGGRQLFNGTDFPAVGAQLDTIGEVVGIARNGLPDAEYLVFILGTIAENFSDTTRLTITTIATLLFQISTLIYLDLYPAEVALEIPVSTPLDPSLFYSVAVAIQNALGGGIGLGFIATYPDTTPTFRFGDLNNPSVGSGGFGDLTNPALGGGIGNLIYSNVGV